jgi:hypothetical protein
LHICDANMPTWFFKATHVVQSISGGCIMRNGNTFYLIHSDSIAPIKLFRSTDKHLWQHTCALSPNGRWAACDLSSWDHDGRRRYELHRFELAPVIDNASISETYQSIVRREAQKNSICTAMVRTGLQLKSQMSSCVIS